MPRNTVAVVTLAIGILLGGVSDPIRARAAPPYVPYVPEDKKLDRAWVASLTARGERKVYRGEERKYVAMPCGGIGAGQIEICGDGTLGSWWIFNQSPPANGGLGQPWTGTRYLKPGVPDKPVNQGFALRIEPAGGEPMVLRLDATDFDDLGFIGEYPMATLQYRRTESPLPLAIQSEVFSPFIPLNVRDSANPITVFRFSVTNTADTPMTVALAGWLENQTFPQEGEDRVNQVFRQADLTGLRLASSSSAVVLHDDSASDSAADILFDDFEGDRFDATWTCTGDAFTQGPVPASVPLNYGMAGHHGRSLASSFPAEGKDKLQGKMVSAPFKITERRYIAFAIGGGKYPGKTALNLVVDGQMVRSATGNNSNTLTDVRWDVADLKGKTAVLEVVDAAAGSYGFIHVDNIRFTDTPASPVHPQFGDMAISVLDGKATASANWKAADTFLADLAAAKLAPTEQRTYPADQMGGGALVSNLQLAPGETGTATFLITWYFPNLYNKQPGCPGWVGHIYNNWYRSSAEVAAYVADHFERLYRETKLFHDTYFNTTIPYWLANRITMPVSTLACDNVKVWENGRLYGYEAVSFCLGTCGHVYNFVAAIARLFPELERSVRLQQDLALAFDPASGRINFRGADGTNPARSWAYASDAQSGYVLKLYREHLMSPDRDFLDRVWPKVKRIIGYMIFHDGACRGLPPNGVLEDVQTFWDPMCYGPNPYNNTLYLAALRAAEEMARFQSEPELADRYHSLYLSGRQWMEEHMWTGEHYVHLYPSGFPGGIRSDNGVIAPRNEQLNAKGYIDAFNSGLPHYYVGGACDAQQLFGQNWAHQLGLGYILSPEHCRQAAASIFRYNWTPNISLVYDLYAPHNRTLAAPGEGAMVNGSWPKKERQPFENIHDKEDVWTGLEYESACDMINEGLLEQALILLRAIHDRYDGRKRNPWNEIEGAEHYSRAMHSWNVLLALSGYTYDGPSGKIGFAPKLKPEDFKCFFSASEGWGSFEQKVQGNAQQALLEVQWGQLNLKEITLTLAGSTTPQSVTIKLRGRTLASRLQIKDGRARIVLQDACVIPAGAKLDIELGT